MSAQLTNSQSYVPGILPRKPGFRIKALMLGSHCLHLSQPFGTPLHFEQPRRISKAEAGAAAALRAAAPAGPKAPAGATTPPVGAAKAPTKASSPGTFA